MEWMNNPTTVQLHGMLRDFFSIHYKLIIPNQIWSHFRWKVKYVRKYKSIYDALIYVSYQIDLFIWNEWIIRLQYSYMEYWEIFFQYTNSSSDQIWSHFWWKVKYVRKLIFSGFSRFQSSAGKLTVLDQFHERFRKEAYVTSVCNHDQSFQKWTTGIVGFSIVQVQDRFNIS